MTKPYIFIRDMPGRRQELLEVASEAEARGFPGVMSPSTGDNITLLHAVLERTERITVGTGIANIYTRHPTEMANAASFIEELHPGRFILGIGVSHPPTHQRLGVDTGRPLSDTRDYVAAMRDVWKGMPFPTLMLAALRDRMTRLAGEISEGVMWANGVRSHMPHSLSQLPEGLPDDFIVSNVVPAAVDQDRDAARERVRRALINYLQLVNYQNYYIEAGYKEEVDAARQAADSGDQDGVLGAISDAMVDDIAVYGTPDDVRAGFQSWVDAGMTHMALSVAGGDYFSSVRALMDAFED
ncbi:MAG: LLM class flavin-dependent oxidoreductase [Thermomicrobiales bacterium]